jgi:hypothetical protein
MVSSTRSLVGPEAELAASRQAAEQRSMSPSAMPAVPEAVPMMRLTPELTMVPAAPEASEEVPMMWLTLALTMTPAAARLALRRRWSPSW